MSSPPNETPPQKKPRHGNSVESPDASEMEVDDVFPAEAQPGPLNPVLDSGSSEGSSSPFSENSAALSTSLPTSSGLGSSLPQSIRTSIGGYSSSASGSSSPSTRVTHLSSSSQTSSAASNPADEELQNRESGYPAQVWINDGFEDIRQGQLEQEEGVRPSRANSSGSDYLPSPNPGSSRQPTPPLTPVVTPSSLLDSSLESKAGRLMGSLASVAESLPPVSGEGRSLREFLDALNGSGLITNVTTTALQALFSSEGPELPSSAGSDESGNDRMDLRGPEFEQAPPGVPDRRDDDSPPSPPTGGIC